MPRRRSVGSVRETPKGSGKYRALLPRTAPFYRAAVEGRFDSVREAQRAIREEMSRIEALEGAVPGARAGGPTRKVKHAVAEYIAARKVDPEGRISARTAQGYESALRKQICHPQANLGEATLKRVTTNELNKWRTDLAAAGVGLASIQGSRRLLVAALNWEIENGRLSHNPAAKVRIRSTKESRRAEQRDAVRVPTWKELSKLIQTPERHEDRLLIALLAFTGLRWSEAVSLDINSLNKKRSTIAVERVLTHTKSTGWVKEPVKAGLANSVFVPRKLMAELVRLAETRTDPPHPIAGKLLFQAPNAAERGGLGVVDLSNFRRTVWVPATLAANLTADPRVPEMDPRSRALKVKDLRASTASFLVDAGATRFEAAEQLRHSSALTTDKYYTRALAERHHSKARARIRGQAELSLHERLNAMFEAWLEQGGVPLKSALFGANGARFGATEATPAA